MASTVAAGPTSMLFVLKKTDTGEFAVVRRLSVSPRYDLGTKAIPFQDVPEDLREGIVRLLNKYNNNEPDAAKHIWGLSACYFPRSDSITIIIDHLPSVRGFATAGDNTRAWPKPIVMMFYSLVTTATSSVFRFAQQVTVAPAYQPAGFIMPFNYMSPEIYHLVQDRAENLSRLSEDPMRKPWALLTLKRTQGTSTGSLLVFFEYQPDAAALDPMAAPLPSRAPSIRINESIEGPSSPITELLPSYANSQAQLDTL